LGYFVKLQHSKLTLALASATLFTLAACGGSGGAGPMATGPTTTNLSGVAAYGAPMAAAAISITDSTGKSITATAGADGSYTADVTGFTAPLLVTATSLSGDSVKKYFALVDTMPAVGSTGTANVTPLTNALAALASSTGLNPEEFAADLSKLQGMDKVKLARALLNLQSALASVLADAGLPSNFDPTKSSFKADRTSPGDVLLDTIKVTQSDLGVTLTNIRVTITSTGDSTATLTLTGATSTPPAALPKPTVVASDLLALDTWTAQVNKCLALAPTSRVSTAGGTYTFLNDCATVTGFSLGYKRNGHTLGEIWGPRLVFIPQGAVMSPPEILSFLKNDLNEDIAIVRLSYNTSLGGDSYVENAKKINGAWQIDGNQRKYDAGVTVAMTRITDASTNGYVVPTIANYTDSAKNIGNFSAYQSRLYFDFNPSGPNGQDVYAVRVKGPGLPAAGYVMARSSACGTDKYMAFYSNNGALPPSTSATVTQTSSNHDRWVLDLKNFGTAYKGTDFYNQWRGLSSTGQANALLNSSIAIAPVDMNSIPEFARYTFEVFTTASGTTAADTFSSRLVTRPLAASFGANLPWAEFTAATQEYVQPGIAAKASEQTQGTVAWTLPAGAPRVSSAYLYGSGKDSAGAAVRAELSNALTFGSTSQLFTKVLSEKNGVGAACTPYTALPSFTAAAGYREIGMRQLTDRSLLLSQYIQHNAR
jgi:hypothetical protein